MYFSNKFKKFVEDSVNRILNNSDLPGYKYTITFINESPHDHSKNNHTVQAEIDVLPEYQSFTLDIFRSLQESFNKGNLDDVFDVLCHEIGHIHTQKLYNLIEEPYKTVVQSDEANEELSTKIGNYIYKICGGKFNGEKKNNTSKKSNSSKK